MQEIFSKFRAHRTKSHTLLWAALTIMLIRGLLSNVVMFDTHTPQGGFGLVICSGNGPLFPAVSIAKASPDPDAMLHNADLDTMPDMAMGDMSMSSPLSVDAEDSHMTDKNPISSGHHGPMNMGGATQGGEAACPFSAALFAAIVTLVTFLFFAIASVRRQRFRQDRLKIVALVTPYRLALSRAPPLPVGH